MSEIFKSASKIVFILMAVAVVILAFLKVIEAKDFIMLATMAFSAYYGSKMPKAEN